MIINASEFPDPDDFEITPRTLTHTRRALSGKVYGSRLKRRDKLQISYSNLKHSDAQAIASLLYEQTAIGLSSIYFQRASSSDIVDCVNAFKGTVEYIDNTQSSDIDPGFTRSVTFTFLVHTYEIF